MGWHLERGRASVVRGRAGVKRRRAAAQGLGIGTWGLGLGDNRTWWEWPSELSKIQLGRGGRWEWEGVVLGFATTCWVFLVVCIILG